MVHEPKKLNIYLVIPLHNEQLHIANVIHDLSSANLPVVLVNDGSDDNSKSEIFKAIGKSKHIDYHYIEHDINLGKGAAMKTGTEYSWNHGADCVIFMDSDGQHKADDLPLFIRTLNTGYYDIVYGSRNLSMGVPLVRYLGNKIASVIGALLFGVYVSDAICGFRAITKKAYKKLKWESTGYGVEIEMVARAGKYKLRHKEIPVETVYLDDVKGVTLLDALGILIQVVKWKLTL